MDAKSPNVDLWEYAWFDQAWERIIAPWFLDCLKSPHQKNIFLSPSTSATVFIKNELLKANIPAIGVEFCTPGRIRKYLRAIYSLNSPMALREDLHLLMRTAAEELAHTPFAAATQMQPDEVVQVYDQWTKAGWPVASYPEEEIRLLLERFQTKIDAAGVSTVQAVDQVISEKQQVDISFDRFLLWGFSWRHWDAYTIARIAVLHAQNTCICFESTGDVVDVAAVWKGSWENAFGSFAEVLLGDKPPLRPYLNLAHKAAFPDRVVPEGNACVLPDIYVSDSPDKEACFVLGKTLAFLADPTCDRVGIIVAREKLVIAREIAASLEGQSIPHFNHLGYNDSGEMPEMIFSAWCAFQDEPFLKQWDHFLESLYRYYPEIKETISKLRKGFSQAFREVLTDDFEVLRAYMLKCSRSEECTQFLEDWPLWPKIASWDVFVKVASAFCEKISWENKVAILQERSDLLTKAILKPVQRGYFQNWLKGIIMPPKRTSNVTGQQIFAKVHLLTANEAVSQKWSHLILVGMRQEDWPGEVKDASLLSEACIYEYNQKALKQGLHGEGDLCLKEGHRWMMSGRERCTYLQRTFYRLIRNVTQKLALTFSIKNQADGGGECVPSELLLQIVSAFSGKVPGPEVFRAIQEAGASNLYSIINDKKDQAALLSLDNTRIAYAKRRDEERPFDEFSFAFKTPPGALVRLSCKAWEDVLKYPASAWYRHVLKLKRNNLDSEKDISSMVEGLWVHDWISLKAFSQKRPDAELWLKLACEKAEVVRGRVTQAYRSSGRSLPDIWAERWNASKRIVAHFVAVLGAEEGCCSYLISEYDIPENCNDKRFYDIQLHGRIDLLASAKPFDLKESSRSENSVSVVDFKTGNMDPFTAKNLKKGNALQLVLYGLAIRQLGFRDVSLCLAKKNNATLETQKLEVFLDEAAFFKGLENLSITGIFGDRGDKRSNFSYTGDYPIASLFVDSEILEKKWALTNPLLVE